MIINNNHVVFRKKKLATALQVGIAMAFSIMSGEVLANPSGENVVHGDVNFDRSQADTLNVNQSSNKAIVNWQDFSVQRGETTNFNQPSVSSSTLNRVVGDNLSQIHGTINATGQVILINKNGVTFGKDGRVNTGGGFISSTMDVQNKDYLEGGDLTFEKGNSKQGVISNQGVIRSGGDVMLIGHSVTSSGAINTGGIAALAAGNKVVVDKQGAHIKQAPKPTRGNHQVTNSGTIRGASVQLKAAGHNPRKTAVRNTGDIYAHGGQPVRKAPVRKAPVKKAANAGRLSQAQIQAKRAQAARQAQFIKNAQAAKKAQATRQAQAIKNAQAAKKSQVARQAQAVKKSQVARQAQAVKKAQSAKKSPARKAPVNAAKRHVQKTQKNNARRGKVTIDGGKGRVEAGGKIRAQNGQKGGHVAIRGGSVKINKSARIDASGQQSGGHVEIQAQVFDAGELDAINSIMEGKGKVFTQKENSVTVKTGAKIVAKSTKGKGGTVKIEANTIKVEAAEINVSSSAGGGKINIGGGFQGKDKSHKNSKNVEITKGATIKADSTEKGDAGEVVVWSDDKTNFEGEISAQAKGNSGDGGNVEVSGKKELTYNGKTDTRAKNGKVGSLLLDPGAISLVDGSGANTANTFNDDTVATALGAANVTIQATDTVAGDGSGDITIGDGVDVTWAAATTLKFDATGDVNFTSAATGIKIDGGTTGGVEILAGDDVIIDATAAGNVEILAGALGLDIKQGTSNGDDLSITAVGGGVALGSGATVAAGNVVIAGDQGKTTIGGATDGDLTITAKTDIEIDGGNADAKPDATSLNQNVALDDAVRGVKISYTGNNANVGSGRTDVLLRAGQDILIKDNAIIETTQQSVLNVVTGVDGDGNNITADRLVQGGSVTLSAARHIELGEDATRTGAVAVGSEFGDTTLLAGVTTATSGTEANDTPDAVGHVNLKGGGINDGDANTTTFTQVGYRLTNLRGNNTGNDRSVGDDSVLSHNNIHAKNGDITVKAGDEILLEGGKAEFSYAQIGHGGTRGSVTNGQVQQYSSVVDSDITIHSGVVTVNKDLTLKTNGIETAQAQIGHGVTVSSNASVNQLSQGDISGEIDILVDNAGNLDLNVLYAGLEEAGADGADVEHDHFIGKIGHGSNFFYNGKGDAVDGSSASVAEVNQGRISGDIVVTLNDASDGVAGGNLTIGAAAAAGVTDDRYTMLSQLGHGAYVRLSYDNGDLGGATNTIKVDLGQIANFEDISGAQSRGSSANAKAGIGSEAGESGTDITVNAGSITVQAKNASQNSGGKSGDVVDNLQRSQIGHGSVTRTESVTPDAVTITDTTDAATTAAAKLAAETAATTAKTAGDALATAKATEGDAQAADDEAQGRVDSAAAAKTGTATDLTGAEQLVTDLTAGGLDTTAADAAVVTATAADTAAAQEVTDAATAKTATASTLVAATTAAAGAQTTSDTATADANTAKTAADAEVTIATVAGGPAEIKNGIIDIDLNEGDISGNILVADTDAEDSKGILLEGDIAAGLIAITNDAVITRIGHGTASYLQTLKGARTDVDGVADGVQADETYRAGDVDILQANIIGANIDVTTQKADGSVLEAKDQDITLKTSIAAGLGAVVYNTATAQIGHGGEALVATGAGVSGAAGEDSTRGGDVIISRGSIWDGVVEQVSVASEDHALYGNTLSGTTDHEVDINITSSDQIILDSDTAAALAAAEANNAISTIGSGQYILVATGDGGSNADEAAAASGGRAGNITIDQNTRAVQANADTTSSGGNGGTIDNNDRARDTANGIRGNIILTAIGTDANDGYNIEMTADNAGALAIAKHNTDISTVGHGGHMELKTGDGGDAGHADTDAAAAGTVDEANGGHGGDIIVNLGDTYIEGDIIANVTGGVKIHSNTTQALSGSKENMVDTGFGHNPRILANTGDGGDGGKQIDLTSATGGRGGDIDITASKITDREGLTDQNYTHDGKSDISVRVHVIDGKGTFTDTDESLIVKASTVGGLGEKKGDDIWAGVGHHVRLLGEGGTGGVGGEARAEFDENISPDTSGGRGGDVSVENKDIAGDIVIDVDRQVHVQTDGGHGGDTQVIASIGHGTDVKVMTQEGGASGQQYDTTSAGNDDAGNVKAGDNDGGIDNTAIGTLESDGYKIRLVDGNDDDKFDNTVTTDNNGTTNNSGRKDGIGFEVDNGTDDTGKLQVITLADITNSGVDLKIGGGTPATGEVEAVGATRDIRQAGVNPNATNTADLAGVGSGATGAYDVDAAVMLHDKEGNPQFIKVTDSTDNVTFFAANTAVNRSIIAAQTKYSVHADDTNTSGPFASNSHLNEEAETISQFNYGDSAYISRNDDGTVTTDLTAVDLRSSAAINARWTYSTSFEGIARDSDYTEVYADLDTGASGTGTVDLVDFDGDGKFDIIDVDHDGNLDVIDRATSDVLNADHTIDYADVTGKSWDAAKTEGGWQLEDFSTANGGRGGDGHARVGLTTGNVWVDAGDTAVNGGVISSDESIVVESKHADGALGDNNDYYEARIGHGAWQVVDAHNETSDRKAGRISASVVSSDSILSSTADQDGHTAANGGNSADGEDNYAINSSGGRGGDVLSVLGDGTDHINANININDDQLVEVVETDVNGNAFVTGYRHKSDGTFYATADVTRVTDSTSTNFGRITAYADSSTDVAGNFNQVIDKTSGTDDASTAVTLVSGTTNAASADTVTTRTSATSTADEDVNNDAYIVNDLKDVAGSDVKQVQFDALYNGQYLSHDSQAIRLETEEGSLGKNNNALIAKIGHGATAFTYSGEGGDGASDGTYTGGPDDSSIVEIANGGRGGDARLTQNQVQGDVTVRAGRGNATDAADFSIIMKQTATGINGVEDMYITQIGHGRQSTLNTGKGGKGDDAQYRSNGGRGGDGSSVQKAITNADILVDTTTFDGNGLQMHSKVEGITGGPNLFRTTIGHGDLAWVGVGKNNVGTEAGFADNGLGGNGPELSDATEQFNETANGGRGGDMTALQLGYNGDVTVDVGSVEGGGDNAIEITSESAAEATATGELHMLTNIGHGGYNTVASNAGGNAGQDGGIDNNPSDGVDRNGGRGGHAVSVASLNGTTGKITVRAHDDIDSDNKREEVLAERNNVTNLDGAATSVLLGSGTAATSGSVTGAHGTLAFDDKGDLVYTSEDADTSNETFTVQVTGPDGVQEVTITVAGVDGSAGATTTTVAKADYLGVASSAAINGEAVNPTETQLVAYADNADITAPVNGEAHIDRNGNVVTYTPTEGFTGTDTFDVTLHLADGTTRVETITVEVTETGTDTRLKSEKLVTSANTAVSFNLLDTQSENTVTTRLLDEALDKDAVAGKDGILIEVKTGGTINRDKSTNTNTAGVGHTEFTRALATDANGGDSINSGTGSTTVSRGDGGDGGDAVSVVGDITGNIVVTNVVASDNSHILQGIDVNHNGDENDSDIIIKTYQDSALESANHRGDARIGHQVASEAIALNAGGDAHDEANPPWGSNATVSAQGGDGGDAKSVQSLLTGSITVNAENSVIVDAQDTAVGAASNVATIGHHQENDVRAGKGGAGSSVLEDESKFANAGTNGLVDNALEANTQAQGSQDKSSSDLAENGATSYGNFSADNLDPESKGKGPLHEIYSALYELKAHIDAGDSEATAWGKLTPAEQSLIKPITGDLAYADNSGDAGSDRKNFLDGHSGSNTQGHADLGGYRLVDENPHDTNDAVAANADESKTAGSTTVESEGAWHTASGNQVEEWSKDKNNRGYFADDRAKNLTSFLDRFIAGRRDQNADTNTIPELSVDEIETLAALMASSGDGGQAVSNQGKITGQINVIARTRDVTDADRGLIVKSASVAADGGFSQAQVGHGQDVIKTLAGDAGVLGVGTLDAKTNGIGGDGGDAIVTQGIMDGDINLLAGHQIHILAEDVAASGTEVRTFVGHRQEVGEERVAYQESPIVVGGLGGEDNEAISFDDTHNGNGGNVTIAQSGVRGDIKLYVNDDRDDDTNSIHIEAKDGAVGGETVEVHVGHDIHVSSAQAGNAGQRRTTAPPLNATSGDDGIKAGVTGVVEGNGGDINLTQGTNGVAIASNAKGANGHYTNVDSTLIVKGRDDVQVTSLTTLGGDARALVGHETSAGEDWPYKDGHIGKLVAGSGGDSISEDADIGTNLDGDGGNVTANLGKVAGDITIASRTGDVDILSETAVGGDADTEIGHQRHLIAESGEASDKHGLGKRTAAEGGNITVTRGALTGDITLEALGQDEYDKEGLAGSAVPATNNFREVIVNAKSAGGGDAETLVGHGEFMSAETGRGGYGNETDYVVDWVTSYLDPLITNAGTATVRDANDVYFALTNIVREIENALRNKDRLNEADVATLNTALANAKTHRDSLATARAGWRAGTVTEQAFVESAITNATAGKADHDTAVAVWVGTDGEQQVSDHADSGHIVYIGTGEVSGNVYARSGQDTDFNDGINHYYTEGETYTQADGSTITGKGGVVEVLADSAGGATAEVELGHRRTVVNSTGTISSSEIGAGGDYTGPDASTPNNSGEGGRIAITNLTTGDVNITADEFVINTKGDTASEVHLSHDVEISNFAEMANLESDIGSGGNITSNQYVGDNPSTTAQESADINITTNYVAKARAGDNTGSTKDAILGSDDGLSYTHLGVQADNSSHSNSDKTEGATGSDYTNRGGDINNIQLVDGDITINLNADATDGNHDLIIQSDSATGDSTTRLGHYVTQNSTSGFGETTLSDELHAHTNAVEDRSANAISQDDGDEVTATQTVRGDINISQVEDLHVVSKGAAANKTYLGHDAENTAQSGSQEDAEASDHGGLTIAKQTVEGKVLLTAERSVKIEKEAANTGEVHVGHQAVQTAISANDVNSGKVASASASGDAPTNATDVISLQQVNAAISITSGEILVSTLEAGEIKDGEGVHLGHETVVNVWTDVEGDAVSTSKIGSGAITLTTTEANTVDANTDTVITLADTDLGDIQLSNETTVGEVQVGHYHESHLTDDSATIAQGSVAAIADIESNITLDASRNIGILDKIGGVVRAGHVLSEEGDLATAPVTESRNAEVASTANLAVLNNAGLSRFVDADEESVITGGEDSNGNDNIDSRIVQNVHADVKLLADDNVEVISTGGTAQAGHYSPDTNNAQVSNANGDNVVSEQVLAGNIVVITGMGNEATGVNDGVVADSTDETGNDDINLNGSAGGLVLVGHDHANVATVNQVQSASGNIWIQAGTDLLVDTARVGHHDYNFDSVAVVDAEGADPSAANVIFDKTTDAEGTSRNRIKGDTTIGAAQNLNPYAEDQILTADVMKIKDSRINSGYRDADGKLRFFIPAQENLTVEGDVKFNDSAATGDATVPRTALADTIFATVDTGTGVSSDHEHYFTNMANSGNWTSNADYVLSGAGSQDDGSLGGYGLANFGFYFAPKPKPEPVVTTRTTIGELAPEKALHVVLDYSGLNLAGTLLHPGYFQTIVNSNSNGNGRFERMRGMMGSFNQDSYPALVQTGTSGLTSVFNRAPTRRLRTGGTGVITQQIIQSTYMTNDQSRMKKEKDRLDRKENRRVRARSGNTSAAKSSIENRDQASVSPKSRVQRLQNLFKAMFFRA